MKNVFENFEIVNSHEHEEIKSFFRNEGYVVSDDFATFYGKYNGADGFVFDESVYVIIFSIDEILSINDTLGVREYSNHAFIFGSNGGDDSFVFDSASGLYFRTPSIGFFDERVDDCHSRSPVEFF